MAGGRPHPDAKFTRRGGLAHFEAVLATLSRLTGLGSCIHDLAGFSRPAGRSLLASTPGQHVHPFCRRAKRVQANRLCLLDDAERANARAGRLRRPFVKRCHAGAIELVVPVIMNGNHVATVFVGPAAERGRPRPSGSDRLPVRSRAELLGLGQLYSVVAGFAARAGEELFLAEIARTRRSEPVRRALELVERGYAEPITVASAARHAYLSPSRLAHLFRDEMGLPFHEYLTTLRVERAKALLAGSSFRVTEVAVRCGFCDQNHFAAVFRKRTGRTPSDYRKAERTSVEA